jgi:dTDP-4-dehydrorhamnose 3,5-epimerase
MIPEPRQTRVTLEELGCSLIHRKWHCDDRGKLTEIYRQDDDKATGKVKQVYLTTCLEGVVKAWHYHKLQYDRFFCVKGLLKVGLMQITTELLVGQVIKYTDVILSEYEPKLLIIPPNLYHGFTSLEGETLILNCPDMMYNSSQPDEYRLKPFQYEFEYANSYWERGTG